MTSFPYLMYGMRVRSDVRFPFIPISAADTDPPDVVVRRITSGAVPEPDGPEVARAPCRTHGVDAVVYRGVGGTWIQVHSVGTYHLPPDRRHVDVYAEPEADEHVLELVLAGLALVLTLHLLGVPSLHAGAVVTEHGGVAFLGPPKHGKSTLASYFVSRGATLLSDDALPLRALQDGIYGVPSLPVMKLQSNGEEGCHKRLFALDGQHQFAQRAARLRALYILRRYDPAMTGRADVVSHRLSARQGLTVLLTQTSNLPFTQPAEAARCLPVYARLSTQAPVRLLSYPTGLEYQPATHARVMADLEADL